jgi:opacity protein-like surface antigen
MRHSSILRLTAAVALAVGIVAASVPASAQYYAGARGSVFLPNDRVDGLSDFDTGWGLEAFAGLPIGPNFGIEAGVGYCRTEWSDSGEAIKEQSIVSAVPLTLTAKGYVPVGTLGRVYAGAGIGAYFAKAEIEGSWKEEGIEIAASDSSNDTAFGYHVVFGGEFAINPRLSLDAQVKWFRAEPKFSFFENSADANSATVDIGGVLLSLGLLFQL